MAAQRAPAIRPALRAVPDARKPDVRTARTDERAEFLSLYHESLNLAAVADAAGRAIEYQGYVNGDMVAVQIGADLRASAARFRRQHRELPSR